MAKDYCSPNDPIARPGVPAQQLASEALARQQAHDDWHEEHPGEPCDPKMFPYSATDYEDIERGDDMMQFGGGGTFEPGDAFVPRGGK